MPSTRPPWCWPTATPARSAPPPWHRRPSPSWPTGSPARWAGWPWRWPSAGAAARRAASRSPAGSTTSPPRSRYLRDNERVTGVWLAGFGTGGALALCAAAADPEVRGVATLGAPADFDDWASHPKRLLEHARDVGIITDPSLPRRRRRLDPRAPRAASGRLRAEGRPASAPRHPRERRRPRARVRRPRPRRRPRRCRAPHHERRRPPRAPRPPGHRRAPRLARPGESDSSSLACGELLRAVGSGLRPRSLLVGSGGAGPSRVGGSGGASAPHAPRRR